ncbi:hypothetical protein D9M72_651090 [compost metagenome]
MLTTVSRTSGTIRKRAARNTGRPGFFRWKTVTIDRIQRNGKTAANPSSAVADVENTRPASEARANAAVTRERTRSSQRLAVAANRTRV